MNLAIWCYLFTNFDLRASRQRLARKPPIRPQVAHTKLLFKKRSELFGPKGHARFR